MIRYPPNLSVTRFWKARCLPRGVFFPALLDRNTLCEVARLVDVGAFEDGDVIGEELGRDGVEERGDKRVAARHRNAEGKAVSEAGHAGGIRDHHDAAAAGHDLLDVAERLL